MNKCKTIVNLILNSSLIADGEIKKNVIVHNEIHALPLLIVKTISVQLQ